MRILIVSDCYAPRLGGIETQVRDLARKLLAIGHEPIVVTATPEGTGRGHSIEDPDGFKVHRITAPIPGELPVHPRAGRELFQLMTSLRPDVVHVHVGIISPFAWSGLEAAIRRGLPVAATFHCVLGPWAAAGALAGPLSPVAHWRRAGVDLTAVSTMLAQEVSRAGGGQAVTVLPNGITIEDWRLRQSPRLVGPGQPIRVVASLRWIARKCPMEVLEAFSRAIEITGCETATLDVYGDGPLREKMHATVAASPLAERINLVGRVERSRLAQDFQAADIYLQTSPADSFGIAALEGRCAGLAVVGVAASGLADFISDGQDGYLADGVAGLAQALARLLTDLDDLNRIKAHNLAVDPLPVWSSAVQLNVQAYERARATARGRYERRRA
ncbi:GDP-mannose-dependent alpha-mannosyltransferase [Actinomyces bovis]|uniref:GDP-mannose-dependent alpha-mannosyltransferase n=1 Tax=Actinomyces bovis TaxID=1658 RepID=A0ABY1VLR3_9ACTO|nr:glycosyltransferase family 4 protein [Actinomyces bovis]SPT52611.1 GDP-mannose-dependent alpha-mannosyltransferase [Actinomyces bovis]VEG54432.1 GDP-mannose-dependent alpha-mannosyltransferase [Actinomyces israelii]